MGPPKGINRSYELGAPVSELKSKKAKKMSQASTTSESQSDTDERIMPSATNGSFEVIKLMHRMKQMIEDLQLEMKFQRSQIKELLESLSNDETTDKEPSSEEDEEESMDEDGEEEEKDDNMTGGRRALMRRIARRRAYN